MNNCPICVGDFAAIEKADCVCTEHEDWIIAVCPDCGFTRFSQTRGVCDMCLSNSPKIKGFGFNKNHRHKLTSNGMGCKDDG